MPCSHIHIVCNSLCCVALYDNTITTVLSWQRSIIGWFYCKEKSEFSEQTQYELQCSKSYSFNIPPSHLSPPLSPLLLPSRREPRSAWPMSAVQRRDAPSGTTCWAVPTCPRSTTRTKRAEQPAALTGYRDTVTQWTVHTWADTLTFRVTSSSEIILK